MLVVLGVYTIVIDEYDVIHVFGVIDEYDVIDVYVVCLICM